MSSECSSLDSKLLAADRRESAEDGRRLRTPEGSVLSAMMKLSRLFMQGAAGTRRPYERWFKY